MKENVEMQSHFLAATMLSALCLLAIPMAGKTSGSQLPERSATAQTAQQRVEINHATLEQLLHVPGMTRTWAQRIVRYRPYRTKLDLLDEGVLPSEVYRRVKDFLIVHREPQ